MADRPRPQELYRHFKGNLYQIVTIAINSETKEEMVADKTVVARYQKVMDKYNAELGVTEQVKKFVLVTDTWSEANKMLTPTQKLIRRNVAAAYKEQIEALFK